MFKVGDKVKTKNAPGPIIGVIVDIYSNGLSEVYIIKLENGAKIKRLFHEIEPVDEKNLDTITISREDFEKAYEKVTHPDNYKDLSDIAYRLLLTSATVVMSDLEKELFGND